VVIIVCRHHCTRPRDPDISFIVATAEEIVRHAHRGYAGCAGSTTYPGTTEELLLAPLTAAGYRVGEEYSLTASRRSD